MDLFFYISASLLLIGAFCAVSLKNPVYSVLSLIFVFCNAACLFVLLGAEFLAAILIIVYVGAVCVLFLFVVMTLDAGRENIKSLSKGGLFVSALLALAVFGNFAWIVFKEAGKISPGKILVGEDSFSIGSVLYTDFILPFQICGIILFAALVSCIALTLKKTEGSKRQDKSRQLAQNRKNITLSKVKNGVGLEGLDYGS